MGLSSGACESSSEPGGSCSGRGDSETVEGSEVRSIVGMETSTVAGSTVLVETSPVETSSGVTGSGVTAGSTGLGR